jgi:hypothetical protein
MQISIRFPLTRYAFLFTVVFGLNLLAAQTSQASYLDMMKWLVKTGAVSSQQVTQSALAYERDLDQISLSIHQERFHADKVRVARNHLSTLKTEINADLPYLPQWMLSVVASDLESTLHKIDGNLKKYRYQRAEDEIAAARNILRETHQYFRGQK